MSTHGLAWVAAPAADPWRAAWQEVWRGSPALAVLGVALLALAVLGVALLALAVPTLVLGWVDSRTVNGLPWAANVFAKPLKFQLSMALQVLTIAWALAWLRRQALAVPARTALVGALVITVVFETVYITVQGARGVPSHFNRATPLEDLAVTLMASGAYVLVGATAWVGLVALWHWLRAAKGPRDPMLLAIALGFILMFFLAGFTGAALGQYRGPFVEPLAGPGNPWPLTGWRMDVGDLRIAHFFGVHAMQALPLLGWLVLRGPQRVAQGALLAAAIVWTGATLGLMQLALSNRGLG